MQKCSTANSLTHQSEDLETNDDEELDVHHAFDPTFEKENSWWCSVCLVGVLMMAPPESIYEVQRASIEEKILLTFNCSESWRTNEKGYKVWFIISRAAQLIFKAVHYSGRKSSKKVSKRAIKIISGIQINAVQDDSTHPSLNCIGWNAWRQPMIPE